MADIFNLSDTWNDGGTVFNGIKLNVTDTASAAGSKLLDLQVGGASKFSADATGNLVSAGNINGASPTEMGYLSGVTSNIQTQLDAAGGGAFGADANTQITPSTPIVLDEATGDEAALTLDYTTNKATSGNDTGLLINQTDTLSPGTSLLADFQVGGVSKFSVASNGITDAVGYTTPNYFATAMGSDLPTYMDRFAIRMASGVELGWTAGTSAFAPRDLSLWRDAANTLAQRNGVNPQTYNIYNTYTSATDFERAHMGWNDTNDTFVIGTEAGSSGGTTRPVLFSSSSTSGFRAGHTSSDYISLGTNSNAAWIIANGAGDKLILGSGEPNGSLCLFSSGGLALGNYPFTDPGDNNMTIAGAIGLHGVTPPAQAAHITDATDATDVITRVNAILVALENIGITAAS